MHAAAVSDRLLQHLQLQLSSHRLGAMACCCQEAGSERKARVSSLNVHVLCTAWWVVYIDRRQARPHMDANAMLAVAWLCPQANYGIWLSTCLRMVTVTSV